MLENAYYRIDLAWIVPTRSWTLGGLTGAGRADVLEINNDYWRSWQWGDYIKRW